MTEAVTRTLPNPQDFSQPNHNPVTAVFLSELTAPPQIVKVEGFGITIRGLPKVPQDVLRESGVGHIAHRLKKLFFNGDRLGSAAFAQKLMSGQPTENSTFRINLVYTFKWCENGDLEVRFLRNHGHAPYWLDAQHNPANPMTDHEVDYFMGLGISLFVHEVTVHFRKVQHDHVQLHGKHLHKFPTPDYITPVPNLLPLPAFDRPTVIS